jgi:hypothetical protein
MFQIKRTRNKGDTKSILKKEYFVFLWHFYANQEKSSKVFGHHQKNNQRITNWREPSYSIHSSLFLLSKIIFLDVVETYHETYLHCLQEACRSKWLDRRNNFNPSEWYWFFTLEWQSSQNEQMQFKFVLLLLSRQMSRH